MGSSCVIIVVLGVITLGGVTYDGTLGGGTLTGTLIGAMVGNLLGTTLVCVVSGCMVLNIFANLSMACNCIYPIFKGVCGPGFLITCIHSLEALVACSVDNNPEMMRCCGKNSTTSACLPPLVLSV